MTNDRFYKLFDLQMWLIEKYEVTKRRLVKPRVLVMEDVNARIHRG